MLYVEYRFSFEFILLEKYLKSMREKMMLGIKIFKERGGLILGSEDDYNKERWLMAWVFKLVDFRKEGE